MIELLLILKSTTSKKIVVKDTESPVLDTRILLSLFTKLILKTIK